MTRRERLEMVVRGEITDELIEDCKRELEKLDERAMKTKEELSPQQKENLRISEKVLEFIYDVEEAQIEEIREGLGEEITRQRLSAICTNLIREGKLKSKDVKVKNKGKRKAYYL